MNPVHEASRAFALHLGNLTHSELTSPRLSVQHDSVSCVVPVEAQMKIFRGFISWLPAALLALAPPPQHSSPPPFFSFASFSFSPPLVGTQVIRCFCFSLLHFSSIEMLFFLHQCNKKKWSIHHFYFQLYKTEAWENGNWVWNYSWSTCFHGLNTTLLILSNMEIWWKMILNVFWDLVCLNYRADVIVTILKQTLII